MNLQPLCRTSSTIVSTSRLEKTRSDYIFRGYTIVNVREAKNGMWCVSATQKPQTLRPPMRRTSSTIVSPSQLPKIANIYDARGYGICHTSDFKNGKKLVHAIQKEANARIPSFSL